jgi:bacillithiol system protein YtxJ
VQAIVQVALVWLITAHLWEKEPLFGDNMIDWIDLQYEGQLQEIKESIKPSVIFKHSTRCGTSAFVKKTFEADWHQSDIPVYYLDLLQYRSLSAQIAETFDIQHESPQLLVIRNGICIYHASHSDISAELPEEYITN